MYNIEPARISGGAWPSFNSGFMGLGAYGGGGWPSPMMSMGNTLNWGGAAYQPQSQNLMAMGGDYWNPQRMGMAMPMEPYQSRSAYRPSNAQQGQPEPYQTMIGTAGASRPGMGYRAERRQAKRQGAAYQPSTQAAGGGGGSPGWANDPNGTPGKEYMAGFFNTPFGQLTTASGGNANMFKKQGGSEEDGLFFMDPNGGWQQTSLANYRAGAGASAIDPNDPRYRDAAGAVTQQFQRTNVPPHLRGY